jgi:VanZ family protein
MPDSQETHEVSERIQRHTVASAVGHKVAWRAFAVLAYAGMIFVLSSLPGKSLPSLAISDKLLHALEFGGLTVLLCRALRAQMITRSSLHVAMVSALAAICYGLIDEAHQLWVPQRLADVADLAADSCGALLAAWGWLKVGERWPRLQ